MIGDKQVQHAVEVIVSELENQESLIVTLQNSRTKYTHENAELMRENDALIEKIDKMSTYIKELEEALADAHLTSTDDLVTDQR